MFREEPSTDEEEDVDFTVKPKPFPNPDLDACLLKQEIKKLRAADRQGKLNEYYGGQEIFRLSSDERETERKSLCTQTMEVLCRGCLGTIGLFKPHFDVVDYEISCGEIERHEAPDYCFDLGPQVRFFQNCAMVEAPRIGYIKTFRMAMTEETEVDIMEMEIPDPNILDNIFEKINEVQAQILTPKSASVIWIFADSISYVILSESSPEKKWTHLQWYRKVLSDLSLIELQVLEHPLFWDRAIHSKIIRARAQFKKMYRVIGGDPVRLVEPPLCPNNLPEFDQEKNFQVKEYRVEGGTRYKIWEQFPYTDTRIIIGNYFPPTEDKDQPMEDIVNVLFGDLRIYSAEIEDSDALSLRLIPQENGDGRPESGVKILDMNANEDNVSVASSGPEVEMIDSDEMFENSQDIIPKLEVPMTSKFDGEVADRESQRDETYRAVQNALVGMWGYQPLSARTYSSSPKWDSHRNRFYEGQPFSSRSEKAVKTSTRIWDPPTDFGYIDDTAPKNRKAVDDQALLENHFIIKKRPLKIENIPIPTDESDANNNGKSDEANFYEMIPPTDQIGNNKGSELFNKHFEEYPGIHGQAVTPNDIRAFKNLGSGIGVDQKSKSGRKTLNSDYNETELIPLTENFKTNELFDSSKASGAGEEAEQTTTV